MTIRTLVVATLAFQLFLSSSASAAESNQQQGPVVSAPDPFAQAMAVRQVAEFARRQRDPAAMLTAARMLQEIPVTGDDSADATFTPTGLLLEAKELAKGDKLLLDQIQVAQSTGRRGVMSSAFGQGLVRTVKPVDPRGVYQFSISAKGGELLRVGAIGDVGRSLAMRMLDAQGKIVCMDDNGDYAPVCQIKPKGVSQYRVDILNKSAAQSRTVILSN